MIHLKTLYEIQQIELASKMVAEILYLCYEKIKPGVSTVELNEVAEKYCADKGVLPSFKGYRGFPYALCISFNEEVVHGFPSDRTVEEGDIISVDCGVNRNGYFGDAAFTKIVGDVPSRVTKLVNTTKDCLQAGIQQATSENHLNDISRAIQKTAERKFFKVIKEYTGHGVGFAVHEDPLVPNYVGRGLNTKLKVGMVIAIEPMLTYGSAKVYVGSDGWVVKTENGNPAAHFEHTLAILEDGPRVLTEL
jgi:methionyl aminopeptidase